ncbi:hypothetical protein [Alkalibacillus silvisoli]|uniref:ABC transporter permease n=1 Tax=Alkalibacillus silvisoli TaxID=392823 RepID=A0ABP3JGU2_9BACI
MSLTEVKPYDVVKKQSRLKINGFVRVFTSLVIAHLVAMVLSYNGTGSMGGSANGGMFNYRFNLISGDMIFIFTLIWAAVIPYGLVKDEQRDIDFTFVSNRLTNHLSNFVFLALMSLFGAIMTLGTSLLFKTLVYLLNSNVSVHTSYAFFDIFIAIAVMFMYILLLASLGYAVSLMMNTHVIMKVVVPVTIFGLAFLDPVHGTFSSMFQFYVFESSLILLSIKVIFTVIALFGVILLVSNRWEVRA